MNLLVIMADQLTPFALGAYGHPSAITPHIDRLANEGLRFDAAYCNSPLCTPGRYAFMTGRYVSRCGGYDNASYMPSTMPTLAHYLRIMGYRTELAGKMHFVGPDQLHGFEERHTTDIYPADFGWVPDWTAPERRIDLWYHNMSSVVQAGPAAITNQLAYDDEVGAAALRAIYDHARSTDDRPLCLVASFIHPHDPYAARRSFWDLYQDVDIPMPWIEQPSPHADDPHSARLRNAIAADAVDIHTSQIRAARRAYLANVSYVDHWVGRLHAALGECGLDDDTAIVFLADHGDMLGERGLWYKMSFFEWSVRIPLIVWSPRRLKPRVVSQPASQVDVLPTLTQLAADTTGARIPEPIDPLDGENLLQFADSGGPQRIIASEYLAEGTSSPMLMLRDARYKYICCRSDPEQLFDLDADPHEQRNLAANRNQDDVVARFRTAAAAHWDPEAVYEAVLADQHRRRVLSGALRLGRYQSWDWQPRRDAANEYTRSHSDLTDLDVTSRFPRPPPFDPRWR